MKFRSTQSFLAWSDGIELFYFFVLGILGGTLFSHWFDSGTVGSVVLTLSFPLQLWTLKNQNKRREIKFEEQLDALRYRGLYPSDGAGSDADVKRLKDMGYRAQALRLYRELHGTPDYKTINAVDAM